jgi:A/G-specific adenine glycosylase
MNLQIAELLLDWYAKNARRLPWRESSEPYAVWISEIMLQQTRVDTVIPYYQRWMEEFPTINELALASEQDVLQLWEGLGYYSRARNLHKTAREVKEKYGGELPAERKDLEKLPGIGVYTAGAIASIAFGLDETALDGNVQRVLSRLFDMGLPVRSPQGKKSLQQLAEKVLPPGEAGTFNQALMDLGATICTPRAPLCSECPLKTLCQANQNGTQAERPVLEKRPAIPHYTVTAAVIQRNGLFLIARRPAKGMLGGLWEFPGGKTEKGEDLETCLKREIREELDADILIETPFGVYRHAYTHFRVTLYAFLCKLNGREPQALEADEIRWVRSSELEDFPMGKIDRQISLKINQAL